MRLFISYAHADAGQVKQIADILRVGGHDPWFDHKLLPGQDWQAELLAAITACDEFVYVLTPESVASEWCQWEFAEAVKQGKPIVPVLLRKCAPPKTISRYQYADFTDGITPETTARLIAGVYTALKIPAADIPPAPLNPQGTPAQAFQPLPSETRAGFKPAPTTPLQLPDLSAILPPPFEWCPIPAGQVTLEAGGYVPESGQTFDVPGFAMAKYPITNAQFDVFAKAKDGYADPQWWDFSDDAKAWRKQNATPLDPAFGGVGDHPRANVTWYEAVAFCRWLTWKALTPNPSPEWRGEKIQITLPTERQWQRAAQGDDGRKYPWGNTFNVNCCNTSEGGIRQTTPVTAYPNGASPFGVMDMAGNVWEWCLTDYNTGADDVNKSAGRRVLRGGSFNSFQDFAAASSRDFYDFPNHRNDYIGLRVVLCAPKRL
jgi:formylglycine-generating enzyme required for sulfatase activity